MCHRPKNTGQIYSHCPPHPPTPSLLLFFPAMLKVIFFSSSPIAESSDFPYVVSVVKGSSCQKSNGLPFSDNGLLVVSAIWTKWHFLGTAHTKILCLSHKDRLVREQIDWGLLCLTNWLSVSCLCFDVFTLSLLGEYINRLDLQPY